MSRGPIQHAGPEERFWAKVTKAQGGCWTWTAARSRSGYGVFSVAAGRVVSAPRWAYESLVGPIPEGMELGHLCGTRACVNPAHHEPVTPRETALRSAGAGRPNSNTHKTHCPHGHLYDEANTYILAGRRYCRPCARTRHREWKARQRARPTS